jgi:pimeloyl-ACP methyl ester carboxylesterase
MEQTSSRAAGNGQLPSCSMPLRLDACLERFRREAVWRTFDTGRYRCPFVVWGSGPALILIPGLCDDPWSFVLPMARLSERFLCIAYAMPTGQGDGANLADYRHTDLTDDLYALCDHLGVGVAYLHGVSFGGTVALRALHDRPERFPRGILQGGFARRPLAFAEVMLASWARWWPGPLAALPGRALVLGQTQQREFDGREAAVWDYYLRQDGKQPMAAIARRALLLHSVDLCRLLPGIRQPMLLVCGDSDPMVGKTCEQQLLAGLPQVLRAEIENCGHLPQYTHPEVLCEVMERFLLGARNNHE